MAFIKNGQGSSLGVVEAPKGQPQEVKTGNNDTTDDMVRKPTQQVVKGS